MRDTRRHLHPAALFLLLSASIAQAGNAPSGPDDDPRQPHPPGVARLRVAQASTPDGSTGSTIDDRTSSDQAPVPPGTDEGVRWKLAPVVWGGDIGYEARVTRSEGESAAHEHMVIGNLRARSYIWQPWFVQIRGALGFVASRLEGAGGDGGDQQPISMTGGVGLNVFPVSRFPFDLSYEVTDSRTSGDIASADYINRRLSVLQSYTTLTGGTYMSARYERSILESDAFGEDRVDSLEANLAHTIGHHSLQFDAGYSLNERDLTQERTSIERLSFRDSYRPHALLSVESQGYVNATDYDPGGSGSSSATGTQTTQLTSFATWRPRERSGLYVTGSLRALAVDSETGEDASKSAVLDASVGANYDLNATTRLLGSLNVGASRSGESDILTTAQSVGISYTPALVPLGKYMLSWNASGSLANQTTSDEPSRQAVTAATGYNFLRSFDIKGQSQASANFGQTVSTTYDTDSGLQYGLTSSASLSWSQSSASGVLDYASATLSDSRTWGDLESEFQMVNLQATRQGLLNALSSWSGNVTIQGSRQKLQSDPTFGSLTLQPTSTETRTISYSVNLTYQHQRAFGVRNLRFLALATANSSQLESRQAGDVDAPPEHIDNSLELRFDYMIGRLVVRLSARTAEIGGGRQEQLLFRVTRYLGTP